MVSLMGSTGKEPTLACLPTQQVPCLSSLVLLTLGVAEAGAKNCYTPGPSAVSLSCATNICHPSLLSKQKGHSHEGAVGCTVSLCPPQTP